MAASLPTEDEPTHPEPSRSDNLIPLKKNTNGNEQLSETADIGSHNPKQTSYDPSYRPHLNSEDGPYESAGTSLESNVLHPETICVESDVCERCGRSKSEGKGLLQLEKDVKQLEEMLQEKEEVIAMLWEENTHKTAELLEIQLQKVKPSIPVSVVSCVVSD